MGSRWMRNLGRAWIWALAGLATPLLAQAEFMPWGNVTGIRVEGQLMGFETSLRAVNPDWSGYVSSSKYNWEGEQTYVRDGQTQTASHWLQGTPLKYTLTCTDTGKGTAKVALKLKVDQDFAMAGAYYCLEVPGAEFYTGTAELLGVASGAAKTSLASARPEGRDAYVRAMAKGIRFRNESRSVDLVFDEAREVILRQDFIGHPAYLNDPKPRQLFAKSDPRQPIANFQAYIALLPGDAKQGQSLEQTFQLKVSGEIDRKDIHLALDTENPGRPFDGISGNYRNQFADKDPQVIQYCLDNLRVTWGRISMWWDAWQPQEGVDPIAQAKEGKLPKHVYAQMELARTLAQRHIPIIVSVWNPPDWAVNHDVHLPKGVSLDMKKMDAIGSSMAKFLRYLKQAYGVEAQLFSFNETDCGVEVFQTPWEHLMHTKALGACFAANGLATRILAGDTGHGTAVANRLVSLLVADQEARQYVGALAFHTYHGCTESDLAAWTASARALNVPLMVTEGGLDSAAHRYAQVFLEPWNQLKEIDLYVRICAACQPSTIMEWQLTSDYSVLIGGGNHGDKGPLRPTMRFWNLKQLGSTPAGAFALPIQSDRPNLSCAAFGDIANGTYAIHLVNTGARRKAGISGIPPQIRSLRCYITDMKRGMEETKPIPVKDGQAQLVLDASAYTSLFGVR